MAKKEGDGKKKVNPEMESRMGEVKKRIKKALREHRVTENKLAAGDTNLQTRLNGQISHDTMLSLETLLLVLDRIPDISAEWLLRGSQPSTVTNSVVGDNNSDNTINDTAVVRGLLLQLEEKDRQINQMLQLLARQSVK